MYNLTLRLLYYIVLIIVLQQENQKSIWKSTWKLQSKLQNNNYVKYFLAGKSLDRNYFLFKRKPIFNFSKSDTIQEF